MLKAPVWQDCQITAFVLLQKNTRQSEYIMWSGRQPSVAFQACCGIVGGCRLPQPRNLCNQVGTLGASGACKDRSEAHSGSASHGATAASKRLVVVLTLLGDCGNAEHLMFLYEVSSIVAGSLRLHLHIDESGSCLPQKQSISSHNRMPAYLKLKAAAAGRRRSHLFSVASAAQTVVAFTPPRKLPPLFI